MKNEEGGLLGRKFWLIKKSGFLLVNCSVLYNLEILTSSFMTEIRKDTAL